MNTGMPLVDLALDATVALILFGMTSVLWLPFVLSIITTIRAVWRGEDPS